MSLRQIAKNAGISPVSLWRFLRGERSLEYYKFKEIAESLGDACPFKLEFKTRVWVKNEKRK